MNSTIEKF